MRIDACFDARSKSCAAEDKARSARLSFSYLNLADPDRPFPHRTNALGDRGNARKKSQPSSSQSSLSRLHSSSVESLQSALMVRSNPIGLVEPSVKRDGYASQRASTEFLAETVRVETYHAERRSSASASGSGFRTGGGLIATGRPYSNTNMFLPFGASSNKDGFGQKWNRKISGGNSTGCSSNSSDDGKSIKEMSSSEASLFIAEGIKQMETLTTMAKSEEAAACGQMDKPPLPRHSRPRMKAKVSTENEESTETVMLPSPFHAVDIALRSTLVEEPPVQVTVKRSRSLCRQTMTETRAKTTTTELAEQQITISLPSSRRTSRNPSQERECKPKRKKHSSKSSKKGSQVEIYSGTFEVRVRKKASSQVLEVESNLVSLKAEDDVTVETHNASSSDDSRVEAEVKESAGGCDARVCDSDEKQERGAKSHSPGIEDRELDLARGQGDCSTANEEQSAKEVAEAVLPTKAAHGRVRHASDAGPTLQGLTEALESLQSQQRNSLLGGFGRTDSTSKTRQRRHSATSSAKCSGSATPSGALSRTRSRSGSIDLFSADYSLKVRHGSVTNLTETSTCHIRCDDQQSIDQLQLCARCHSHDHATSKCAQFGNLFCPRCLDWNHWEDTCMAVNMLCTTCNFSGHCPIVHTAENFEQRRVVVDTLGWEPFKVWFYESTFRSWWQLNGHVGVPLYKIYPRNSEWRYEIGALEPDDEEIEGLVKAICAPSRRTTTRTSSIVDRIKAGAVCNGTVAATSKADSGGDSGRSTPEYLKKYPGSKDIPDDDDATDDEVKDDAEAPPKMPTRLRTFSETLKMLDPDILAELNV